MERIGLAEQEQIIKSVHSFCSPTFLAVYQICLSVHSCCRKVDGKIYTLLLPPILISSAHALNLECKMYIHPSIHPYKEAFFYSALLSVCACVTVILSIVMYILCNKYVHIHSYIHTFPISHNFLD